MFWTVCQKKNNNKRKRNYSDKKENKWINNEVEDEEDNDKNGKEGHNDCNDNRDYDKEDDINEVKIQLVITSNDIKTPIAKILIIKPVSYKNVMKKINSTTRRILGKEKPTDNYIISYKAVNARGPSNTLEDKFDFQEFISEYQKVTSSGKKMLVTATVKSNVTGKKNRKSKKVKFFIYLRDNKQKI